MTALGSDTVPYLPRGVRLHHCDVRQGWFLLAPERAVKLDPIGVAILNEIDGTRALGIVVTNLSEAFGAPEDQVSKDTHRFVTDLVGRRMMEVRA